jgi:Glycosyl hydrolases family 2, sugar binding domain
VAFVDGKRVPAASEIPLPRGARQVVLRVDAREVLDTPFELQTTPAPWPLGTWNIPALEHFSGAITYEKEVEVPAALLEERVLLDCGQVGVAAEVWVNGAHAGVRPWQPFVLDVSEQLRPGRNHFKVRVVNTEGNARAVGNSIGNLKNIDLNGWMGPARLVPYWEREIHCRAL